jgi:hypothetical protein
MNQSHLTVGRTFSFKTVVVKPLVRGLMNILPSRIFNALFDFLFPIYKFLVRQVYLLLAILRLDFLNRERWETIRKVYSVAPFSLVGTGGLEVTYEETRRLNKAAVPGDFIELGVARGGCAALMAFGAQDSRAPFRRHLWLFDSYEGLPEPGPQDFVDSQSTGDHVRPLPKGSCLGTIEDVQSMLFGRFKLDPSRISLVKGWFQDTVPQHAPKIGQVAMLRMDGDWYESTMIALEAFYDRVSPAGSVVVDDYLSCIGCKRAVDDFIKKRNLNVELIFDNRGGCYFEKPR